MKQFKLTFLLTILMSMVGLQAFAYDAKIGGIYYNFSGDKASVTYDNENYVSEGDNSFYSGSIVIPKTVYYNTQTYTVTSIGYDAFIGCSGLTSINIPSSVTSIGFDAFQGCTGLTSINIPSSVTTIGGDAFSGCSGLTSIIVQSGNTKYDSRNDCNAIIETNTNMLIAGCKNTIIPNSVTRIGGGAFSECSSLISINIPSSVTSIGGYVFEGCSGLTSIEIPSSVMTIDDSAFRGCSGLTSIEIPSSVTSIGNGAFSGCIGLTSITVESGNTEYDSRNNCNAIIETSSNTLIAGCKNTVIPNGVSSIGHTAFWGCTGLTSIVIPSSVTSIGDYAFLDCTGLTSVEIPNSVTSMGINAFQNCTSLSSIEIPSSVTSIGKSAFSGCTGLNSIVIPTSVTSIGGQAFMGCTGLTSVEIPNSVTTIDNSAFANCTSLASIEIPSSVTSVASSAFRHCVGLTSILVQSGNTKYDSRNNCNAIIETSSNTLIAGCINTTIPNSVTRIGGSAFSECPGLISINIPSSVTSIGGYAFFECTGLTSVEIPSSVITIGERAFLFCRSLRTVKVNSEHPISISSETFSNLAANLYVPKGSKAAYAAADCWKDFREILEIRNTEGIIADGVYYLKNVETGKYLSKGNTWGTHAVLDNEGLPARLVRMPDDSYTLTFTEGSRFENKLFRASGDAVYVDYNNQSDGCPYWTITKAETDGTYYIQSRVDHPVYGQTALPGTYLGNNPEKAALDEFSHSFGRYNDVDGNVTNTEGMNITWQFVPAAERCTRLQMSQILALIDLAKTLGISTSEAEAIAANANKEQVIVTISSLKSSIMQTLRDGASASLFPIDLSALIVNPSFVGNDDGWEGTIPAFQIFNCAEFFETTFDFHQTLTGLPNGKYLLKMKGFHRPGNNQIVYTAYKEGNTATTAELYANGNSTKLAHHSSGARDDGELGNDGVSVVYNSHTQYVPNSMFGGRRWFDAQENYYVNELPVSVTDGTLTFGVRLDESVTQGWVLFDDFQLEFLVDEEIAKDTYYLKNVETGKYLSKGNIWGTHAVLDNEGLPICIERMPDDSYTLTFTEGSQFEKKLFRNSEGTFVDYNNQSDGCPYWTITKAETDGTYYIQSLVDHPIYGQMALPGTYLGNNPEKAALDEYSHPFGRYNDVDGDVTNTVGMNITWQLVPAAERCTRLQMSQILALIELAKTIGLSTTEAETIAAIANKEQVVTTISSLKSSIMQTLRNRISASLFPIDLSALIVNPSFVAGNADGWEGTIPAFQIFNCAEFFETTFDFHQTLTGLPNGKYLLKMKGFHRPGNNQIVYTAYKEGNTVTTAELYANGNSTKLAHHSSGARDDGELGMNRVSVTYDSQTQYVPNSMIDGRRWFDAQENYYVNELPVIVTDGTLTFGVRLDESVTQGWVLFDDFQLEYLGLEITMGSNGIATYSSNVDLDFTSVSGLKAYIGSGYNPATGDLTMTRVYKVPAGEGLLVKGAAGSYEVPYEETSAYYANLLVGVPTAMTVSPTDGDYTNFILANDEVKGIGFYPLASAGEIGANKAYLQLPTSILPAASRSLRMVFEDEEDVTGIKDLNEKGAMRNEKFFDLQGRRVVKPTRGLYIKDGKKIMVK